MSSPTINLNWTQFQLNLNLFNSDKAHCSSQKQKHTWGSVTSTKWKILHFCNHPYTGCSIIIYCYTPQIKDYCWWVHTVNHIITASAVKGRLCFMFLLFCWCCLHVSGLSLHIQSSTSAKICIFVLISELKFNFFLKSCLSECNRWELLHSEQGVSLFW